MAVTRHGANGTIVQMIVMEQPRDTEHVMILHHVMAGKIVAIAGGTH